MSQNSWFDALSEILNRPLPGTEDKAQAPVDKPVVFTDDDDDDSLLDKITDILSKPLPGTETKAPAEKPDPKAKKKPVAKKAETFCTIRNSLISTLNWNGKFLKAEIQVYFTWARKMKNGRTVFLLFRY